MYYLFLCGHAVCKISSYCACLLTHVLSVTLWPCFICNYVAMVFTSFPGYSACLHTHLLSGTLWSCCLHDFLVTVQLRKQRAAKDEYRHRLGAGVLRQGGANEVTVAEMVDMSKARKQREPVARPGLPGSGKEVSQMLQMVLPPLYTEVLIPFCEEEARNRSK